MTAARGPEPELPLRLQERQRAAEAIAAHIQKIDPQPGETRTDVLRRWINQSSVSDIDEEYRAYKGRITLMMRDMLTHASGKRPKVHMACNARAAAMAYVLESQGVRTRAVHAWSDKRDSLRGHTFLEVMNEEGRWEAHDPHLDVFYIDTRTGERVAAEHLLREPLDRFMPCRVEGDCGWRHAAILRDHDYFAALGYKQYAPGRGVPRVLVNLRRFDDTKIFTRDDGPHDFEAYILRDWGKGPTDIQVINASTRYSPHP